MRAISCSDGVLNSDPGHAGEGTESLFLHSLALSGLLKQTGERPDEQAYCRLRARDPQGDHRPAAGLAQDLFPARRGAGPARADLARSCSPGEPNLPVYDTTGPYTDPNVVIDVEKGLARGRTAWVRERGGVEEYDGPQRESRKIDRNVGEKHAARE